MSWPLKNCCFFVELRTGCLITGYLSLISNLVLTSLAIIGLVDLQNSSIYARRDFNQWRLENVFAAIGAGVIFIFYTAVLIIVTFNAIFDTILLIGVHKRMRGLLVAYIVFSIISIVLQLFTFIDGVITSVEVGITVSLFIIILIRSYFVVVFGSYYKQLTAEDSKHYNNLANSMDITA